jgi:hypothetical protein
VKPEEIGMQVEVALRQALDAHFETMSNLNLGQMYVPMEENPSNSKVVSRENTDYDTFGSIDSLIFEPKIPTHEDIKEAQEEIEQQFEYLDHIGVDESVYDDITPAKKPEDIISPGKTTFAERVRLFQKLGKKEQETDTKRIMTPIQRPAKKITMLDVYGQETTWREVAKAKDKKKLGNEALKVIENAFGRVKLERKEESASEDEEEELMSVCPDCQNLPPNGEDSIGTVGCSTCDCCTQCDAEEEEERKRRAAEENPYHISTATASWDFERGEGRKPAIPLKQDKGRPRSIENNVVTAKSKADGGPAPVVGNLRQRLKEAFGADYSGQLTDLIVEHASDQQSYYEPLTYVSSSVERDVDHQEDFLIEYGKKQNLFPTMSFDSDQQRQQHHDDDETRSSGGSSSALLLRDGKATHLTEEMFRGDFLKGSTRIKVNRKMGSSDMGDSGIGSPHRAAEGHLNSVQTQPQGDALRDSPELNTGEEFVSGGGDSGLEVGEKVLATPPEPPPLPAPPSISSGTLFLITPKPAGVAVVPPFKKRDTMIRELKSKLKEKFSIESSSTSSSENNSMVKITPQRAATMGDLRASVGPKLSKVFESRRVHVIQKVSDKSVHNDYESSIYDPSLPNEISIEPPFQTFAPPPPPQPVVEIIRRDSPLSIVRESPSGSSAASASTVKEKVLRRTETPVQNPGEVIIEDLPQRELTASPQNTRELLYGPGGIFGPKGPFSTPNVRYPFGMDVGQPSSSKRNVHFEPNSSRPQITSRASKKSSAFSSEVSSAAEDRSDKSHYVVVNDVVSFHARPSGPASPITVSSPTPIESKPSSRIEMYRTEWNEGPEVAPPPPPSRGASPSKTVQWREEKNKRMLAWVNNSQAAGFLGTELPIWKVGYLRL